MRITVRYKFVTGISALQKSLLNMGFKKLTRVTTFCFLVLICALSFHRHAQAFEVSQLNELVNRVDNELPMPIGEAVESMEEWLSEKSIDTDTKRLIASYYVQYLLKLHQSPNDSIFAILQTLENDSQQGLTVSTGIARIYGLNADYQQSYSFFDKVISHPAASAKVKAYAIAYLILTYSEGQVFAPNAKLISELNLLLTENDLQQLRPLYDTIVADYYQSISAFDIALDYYQKSLNGAEKSQQWVLMSDSLYAIGILYRNIGQYEKALEYFNYAITHDVKIDIQYSEYLATYGMATTYFRAQRLDEALTLSEEILAHPLTSSFYDSEIYRLKAEAHLSRGELEKAETALNMARDLYDNNRPGESTTWRAQLEQTASQITAARGDYQLAFSQYEKFHQEYIKAKKYEDLELIESANLVQQIEQEKQKALQLEKENEAFNELFKAQNAAQESQSLYSKLLVLLVLLTLSTIVIILLLLRKSHKTNKLYLDAKEKAELHSRLKTEFISNISHEIRTPLNAIIGFGQVLIDKMQDRENKKLTRRIVSSSQMLLQLINDLLDFAKIEAGKFELELESHNLKKSVSNLADIFYEQASLKGLSLRFNIDKTLPKYLVFDELRLKQVLANLISNAIKFSDAGNIEIGIGVEHIEENICTLSVWVKDEGIGLSQSQQDHLFSPFTQAESSTARKYGGTGLGLNISNNLLALMNSSLNVESEKGSGATFSFTLSLAVGDEKEEKRSPSSASAPAHIQFKKCRILLAEDNEINVEVIRSLLSNTNAVIDRVENGIQALEALSDASYDLILMDIQMPQMDGYEASRIIRKKRNIKTPIIALTANAMQHDIEESKKAGMNAHISKPIERVKLIEVLSSYLG